MSHRNKTTPKQHLRSVTSTPGLQRSGIRKTSTASSPSLRSVTQAEINRKASLQALNGRTMPATPVSNGSLDVGDMVNVPGDMYGTVRFIGSVRGKPGRFVGVELDQEFAAKGKNDGDVDGTKYFHTDVPGAGIFLPVHRAERRSPDDAFDSYPGTPSTPSHSTFNGRRTTNKNTYTPPTPALPAKFSQSVGPGARPSSPMFKPKRPSLPRPESPLRRQPNLAPTPNPRPGFSQSVRGGRPPAGATPNKPSFKASTSGRPPTAAAPRPYSRTGSRMGSRADEEAQGQNGRGSTGQSFSQPLRSPSRLGSAHGQDAEITKLKAQLAERDRRLEEQANNLAEMESSVKELSALIPTDGSSPGGGRVSDYDDKSSAQLRQALREKNEKISILTADFDAHRADFRSTLDSLEMASTETERVYEEQKRDLLAQISELQEMRQNQEDFEGVAEQLKQLEELVAELEEGLEESRRGEAEARGEVEFLRGEVERGRSELRREREKAAAALQDAGGNAPSSKELEAKDDEIKGLKAIIHGLSDGQNTPNTNASSGADNDDVQRLQAALEESRLEREELELEVEQLRRDNASAKMAGQNHARHASELTEKALPMRPRRDTVKAAAPLEEHTVHEQDEEEEDHDENGRRANTHDPESEALFCELCKSPEHDTLDCTSLRAPASDSLARDDPSPNHHHDDEPADMPKPLSLGGKEKDEPKEAAVPAKEKLAENDEDKWCALCEKDGHLAFDCPEEQY